MLPRIGAEAPLQLRPESLTRSEMGAIIEALFYRTPWYEGGIGWIRANMPDAFERLTGVPAKVRS